MVFNHEEEELLLRLGGPDHHLAMSKGIIKEGIIYVTEGPLIGWEGMIRKIDRHKRIAMLGTGLINDGWKIKAGLEIVSKS